MCQLLQSHTFSWRLQASFVGSFTIKVHRRLGITNGVDFEFLPICCAEPARADIIGITGVTSAGP